MGNIKQCFFSRGAAALHKPSLCLESLRHHLKARLEPAACSEGPYWLWRDRWGERGQAQGPPSSGESSWKVL